MINAGVKLVTTIMSEFFFWIHKTQVNNKTLILTNTCVLVEINKHWLNMFILGNNVRLMLVTHSCFREECRLTCPLDGAKFAQEARESSADMKCDMNAEQQYSFGRCNMKCLSSVMPGVCRQVRNFGICEFMTFNATQSIQISPVVFMPNITTNHAITYTN